MHKYLLIRLLSDIFLSKNNLFLLVFACICFIFVTRFVTCKNEKMRKEIVRLREKNLRGGRKSLYLDIYSDGKRTYEFLSLYLEPGAAKEIRERNKQTLSAAMAIRNQRELDHRPNNTDAKLLSCVNFRPLIYHIKNYDPSISVSKVTSKWVDGLITHIRQSGVSDASLHVYVTQLRKVFRLAECDGIMVKRGIFSHVSIHRTAAKKEYLTLDEIKLLTSRIKTDLHRAFLFSCFTGLRISDVKKMKWSDFNVDNGMTRLFFRQKKTLRFEYLDISKTAMQFLPNKKEGEDLVFKLPSSVRQIIDWTHKAGIRKHITYHCSRHTFAVLMLNLNTDIYTVSKLLGHTDVKTTQVYAKIVDEKKRSAVKKLDNIL